MAGTEVTSKISTGGNGTMVEKVGAPSFTRPIIAVTQDCRKDTKCIGYFNSLNKEHRSTRVPPESATLQLFYPMMLRSKL